MSDNHALRKLGYIPEKNWRITIREHLADLKSQGYPSPQLCQPI